MTEFHSIALGRTSFDLPRIDRCPECGMRHGVIYMHGNITEEEYIDAADRVRHPWKYPDRPRRPLHIDLFPEVTRALWALSEARWRITEAVRILRHGDDR